jgi:hypothetical protein
VDRAGRFQQLLGHRWVLVLLAVAIGLIPLLLFSTTVQRDYYEYQMFPRDRVPQVRYTIYDLGRLLWCLNGFAVCGLALRSAISKRSVSGWTYRTMVVYFVLFAALFRGGILISTAQLHGF